MRARQCVYADLMKRVSQVGNDADVIATRRVVLHGCASIVRDM